jgi:hypothetical protein
MYPNINHFTFNSILVKSFFLTAESNQFIKGLVPGASYTTNFLYLTLDMFGLTYLNLSIDISTCETVWNDLFELI